MAGPPSWAPPAWWTDSGDAIQISRNGEVTANKGSSVKIRAFMADTLAEATMRVNPSSLLVRVPSFYFNQVNQNPDGTVPILAGRKALLRVFVTGDETSYFRPSVRANFYRNGEIVHTTLIAPASDELPTGMVEGNLVNSYNTVIPGQVFQPGTELVIEVDPAKVIPLKPGSQIRIPEQGTMPLDIVVLRNHHQVIVPTIFNHRPNADGALAWVRDLTIESNHIRPLRNWMPISDITVEGHATLHSDVRLTGGSGWGAWLREVNALWQTEGQKGNYYGATENFWGGGIQGLASAIGYPPVSIGITDVETFVHEVGHTLALRHAPGCGAGGPDPGYPYAGGITGMWGYNFEGNALVSPDGTYDLMTYCGPVWISDYFFAKAMTYRQRERDAQPPPPEQTLLLWGSASEEEVLLDPAFLIESPPTETPAGGPYRLEGFGPAGELRFGFNFTPVPLADADGAVFLFTMPYDPDTDGILERIVLSGPDGEDTLSPGSTRPMAIMRDGPTGPIRAFLRDWDGTVPPGVEGADLRVQVLLSDGIPGGVR